MRNPNKLSVIKECFTLLSSLHISRDEKAVIRLFKSGRNLSTELQLLHRVFKYILTGYLAL